MHLTFSNPVFQTKFVLGNNFLCCTSTSSSCFSVALSSALLTYKSLFAYSCMLRVVDTFGTEPAFNLDTYVKRHGTKSNWGKWNLVPRQFFTLFRKYLTVFHKGPVPCFVSIIALFHCFIRIPTLFCIFVLFLKYC